MRTAFVIITNSDSTKQELDNVTSAIKKEAGWWHWYSQAWLVADEKGRDVVWWRVYLRGIAPEMHFLVFETTGRWAGFSSPQHFKWIRQAFGPSSKPPAG